MSVIIVKSQKELDKIPLDTENKIQIHFGSYWDPAIIKNSYKNHVEAYDNSSVEAYDNSSVEALGNAMDLNPTAGCKIISKITN